MVVLTVGLRGSPRAGVGIVVVEVVVKVAPTVVVVEEKKEEAVLIRARIAFASSEAAPPRPWPERQTQSLGAKFRALFLM